jgi:parvulin-like peptidyl-prolyl isomerase
VARKKTGARAQTKTTPTTTSAAAKKPSKWIGILAIIGGVILLAYIVYGVVLHFANLTDGFTKFWTTIFFYPAATILTKDYWGWALLSLLLPLVVLLALAKLVYLGIKKKKLDRTRFIIVTVALLVMIVAQFWIPPVSNLSVGYSEYITRVDALNNLQAQQQQLQQGQQKPSKSEISASALQQLVQGDVIRQVAVKLDVNVSSKEVNDFYKQMADQNQGEANLKKQLHDLLGWTPAQFKQEIKLRLMQEKISNKLASDKELNKANMQKAQDYLKQLQSGKDFTEVAKESSSGVAIDPSTAGQAVTIKKGEADPKVEAFAFKANPGELSGILETQSGYVIAKVVEKPSADEVKIQQIIIPTLSINEYFSTQLKDTKVNIYVHDLVWNKLLYTVQPKNQKNQPQPSVIQTGSPAAAPQTTEAPAAQ